MIRIKNLNFAYDMTPVLRDIDIDFEEAGVYGILGPNGAGKSTLLKLIGGLLKCERGHIIIDGKDISRYKRHDLAKIIAYVLSRSR